MFLSYVSHMTTAKPLESVKVRQSINQNQSYQHRNFYAINTGCTAATAATAVVAVGARKNVWETKRWSSTVRAAHHVRFRCIFAVERAALTPLQKLRTWPTVHRPPCAQRSTWFISSGRPPQCHVWKMQTCDSSTLGGRFRHRRAYFCNKTFFFLRHFYLCSPVIVAAACRRRPVAVLIQ